MRKMCSSWIGLIGLIGAPIDQRSFRAAKFRRELRRSVYVEKKNVDAYLKTDSFPEGTVIVKELTQVLDPTFPDGSRNEPSGRGYFNGVSPCKPTK